ncbi:receptor-like protein 2 [Pyrus ussuriensis x Pyrus communis]|uniref:Receptor-like protein 2 n=1 Tax=Pyrus ussuriensis x Pyrus communis TaxID=2448454 RepID=A0A5N5HDS0_9ROSA|nr:receptor-like protein 2 [Pyrus ussuriensis x Pyrus communis]
MKILMQCKSLQTLLLSSQFDHEVMPIDDDMVDFQGFQNLRVLILSDYRLIGQIHGWLSNLKNLGNLYLGGHQITGSIPSWLGTLPKLFSLSLESNQISGEFPKQLCRLLLLISASRVDNYEFKLPIIDGLIKVLRFLSCKLSNFPGSISLNHNNINGNIPIEICQLQLLHELFFDNNNFSGNIPSQMSNLKYLETLDLSTNHLSGTIPSSMASLNFLKEFDVSSRASAPVFEGNPKLCGALLPNEYREIDVDSKNNFYIFATLGFIVGFWGVCSFLVLKKTWRYAYFRFLDTIQDSLYLKITMCIARMRIRVRD